MTSFRDSQLICGNTNISQNLRNANCLLQFLLAIRNLIFDKTADFIIHALLALLIEANMNLIGGVADTLLQCTPGPWNGGDSKGCCIRFIHRRLLSKFLVIR